MRRLTTFFILSFLITAPLLVSADDVDEQVRKMRQVQAQMGYLQAQIAAFFRNSGGGGAQLQPQPQGQTFIGLNIKRNLSHGLTNDKDVLNLQQFLTRVGYYNGPITGNYLNLTREAVLKYQKANGIEQTGFFGPLSRARAARP